MNTLKTLSITASLVAAFASGSAFADTDEYTRNLNFPQATAASTQRADVRAARVKAVRAGDVAQNEYERNQYPKAVTPSTLQRVQVVAEAIEARRLGVIAEGEITKVPTAAQRAQVRMAGVQAVRSDVAGQPARGL